MGSYYLIFIFLHLRVVSTTLVPLLFKWRLTLLLLMKPWYSRWKKQTNKKHMALNCIYIMSHALTHSVQQRAVGNPLAASAYPQGRGILEWIFLSDRFLRGTCQCIWETPCNFKILFLFILWRKIQSSLWVKDSAFLDILKLCLTYKKCLWLCWLFSEFCCSLAYAFQYATVQNRGLVPFLFPFTCLVDYGEGRINSRNKTQK